MGIRAANRDYERWLASQLNGEVVDGDLDKKHKRMGENAFAFLRATYWRWAETILDVCPDLANAPTVLRSATSIWKISAPGPTKKATSSGASTITTKPPRCPTSSIWCGSPPARHSQPRRNRFRSRRFARMSSMATSTALMRRKPSCSTVSICGCASASWSEKLPAPSSGRRSTASITICWSKKNPEQPPARWLKLFAGAMPDSSVTLTYWRHTAGTGSLGRPRWLGYGTWHGGPLLREGKALVPSGWTPRAWATVRVCVSTTLHSANTAHPTPWYAASGNLLVRRRSPDNLKINVEDRRDATLLLHPDLLWAMGRDLAAIHLGARDRRDALRKDLEKRKQRSFRACVETAVEFVAREYAEWKKSS